MRPIALLPIAGLLLLLWPIAPPLLRLAHLEAAAIALEEPWSMTCHRLPDRTIAIRSYLMPMCSRCMGLDMGLGAGLIAGAPYHGPKLLWAWLAVAAALMLLEIELQDLGVHPVWHATRALSGILLAYPVGAAITALARRA